jgi:hypothetical protein
MRDKQARLARIRAAKAELEAEARQGKQKLPSRYRLALQKAPPNRGRADRPHTLQASRNPRLSATSPIRKVGS